MNTSIRIGAVGIVIILLAWLSITNGSDANAHQTRYAQHGRTAEGEVVSQVQTSHVSGRRIKTHQTAYQLQIVFKLPDGTSIAKNIQVPEPVRPSADGKTRVSVRYLPENPHGSAEIEGNNYHTGNGDEEIQSGLFWLGIGAIPLGIACLRERATIRNFFSRRS